MTAGDKVKFSVTLTDNIEIKNANIILRNRESNTETDRDFHFNSESGKWELEFEIAESTWTGRWSITRISAWDGISTTNLWNSDVLTNTPNTDLSAFDFTVAKCYRVAFNSNGGSEIAPQYVLPGETALPPEEPTNGGSSWQGGGDFAGWYADEGLSQKFNFNTPINEDITLYAGWYYAFSISNYDITNHTDETGGKYAVLYGWETEEKWHWGCTNMTLFSGEKRTLKAKADPGYIFIGWYKGVYTGGSGGQAAEPLDITDPDNLISNGDTYEYTVSGYEVICPVFEVCSAHDWEQKIQKATPDADGRIYQICRICEAEETVAPLLKVSNISLEGTSYPWTGEAIEPKITVANASEELAPDNYDVTYTNNVNAGTATVTVTLKGDYYEGSKELTFTITKPGGSEGSSEDQGGTGNNPGGSGNAPGITGSDSSTDKKANPMTVKGKTVKIRYLKLSKKTQYIKRTKAIKLSKAKGKVTYKLVSVTKKKFKKYFKVNAKNGKVTVRKGLPAGTYKVKVKVTAAGNKDYKKRSKTIKVTIKVTK